MTDQQISFDTEVGTPPTLEDKYWLEMAKELKPEKTLERLDAHAKFLFANVGIVGTVLTGLGVFGASVPFLENRLILVPIFLACLSLVFAMLGITPRVERVHLQDVESIRQYYGRLIQWRGRGVQYAGILFAMSLFSAGLVLVSPAEPRVLEPTLSLRVSGTGDKTVLTGSVEVANIPIGGVAETEIIGVQQTKQRSKETILFKDVSRATKTGKVTLSLELDRLGLYKRFLMTSRVKVKDQVLREQKTEVAR
jgi:hypothetical protein